MSRDEKNGITRLDRRTLLRGGAAAALAAPLGVFGAQAFPFRAATPGIDFSEFPICRTASNAPALTGAPRKLKLSWNAGAVCLVPVPVAIDQGIFKKHNLDVELINYSGSTDQLLEAIATGKSDAGLGMALRWLKPLEQGFDVKIAAGTHGGCMRVLSRTNSRRRQARPTSRARSSRSAISAGRTRISSRSSLPSRASIPTRGGRLARLSRQSAAAGVEKGEVQAFLASDPIAHIWLKDSAYKRRSLPTSTVNTRTRPAASSDCAAAWFAREPQVARAITQALLDACDVHRAKPTRPRPRSSLTRPRRRACRICRRWSATTPIITIPSAKC